eukprot:TRINITY_DN56417_c0_g1_i1.p1 TRINITY_DN56417_c0_g1~~TRINITY_DN56417_c0_g1_i1.p1  ORF type:complete len:360 (-),score=75.48 TRINITY_DN56417_c0_g1_i1:187-1266(-)
MKAVILLSFALVAASSATFRLDSSLETFEALSAHHKRSYTRGSPEYAKRYAIFQANEARIREAQKSDSKARFGWNKFFDLSKEEFAARYKMPVRRTDSKSSADMARSCLGGGATVDTRDTFQAPRGLPTSFDWRSDSRGVVSAVKNQESCGSCWAFSTTETIESAWTLAGNKPVVLAPQQIVDCSHGCANEPPYGKVCNSGCNGGWPWAAFMDTIRMGGVDTEADYPYRGVQGACGFNRSKTAAHISNYTCVSGPATAQPEAMMRTLMARGPLSIAMNAEWWQFYFGGLSDPMECDAKSLDHAIQLVGWGEQKGWTGETEYYWIVRNSWGADWGEDGYIKIARGQNSCGVGNAVSYATV